MSDIEEQWHDTAEKLLGLIVFLVAAAFAVTVAIVLAPGPTLEQIAEADERAWLAYRIESVVDPYLPGLSRTPRYSDETTPYEIDRFLRNIPTSLSNVGFVHQGFAELASRMNAAASTDAFFDNECGTGFNPNEYQPIVPSVGHLGGLFWSANDNLEGVMSQLQANAIGDGNLNEMSPFAAFLLLRDYGGPKSRSVDIVASHMMSSPRWFCRATALAEIFKMSLWQNAEFSRDNPWHGNSRKILEFAQAMSSSDAALASVREAKSPLVRESAIRFEGERDELLKRYAGVLPTSLVDWLPPISLNMFVAYYPLVLAAANLWALLYLYALGRSIRSGTVVTPVPWQHRLSDLLALPIPRLAGGRPMEYWLSVLAAVLPAGFAIGLFVFSFRNFSGDVVIRRLVDEPRAFTDTSPQASPIGELLEAHVPDLASRDQLATTFYFLFAAAMVAVALNLGGQWLVRRRIRKVHDLQFAPSSG